MQKLQLLGQARPLNVRAASGAPPLTQTAGLPDGGGGDTPTYIPQNDPRDTLFILNTHNWGKFFQKKFAHQLRLPSAKVRPGGRVGVNILFCVFHPFLNSPQNSEYFEHRHIGSSKKPSPCRLPKKKFSGASGAHKTYCSSQLADYKTMPLECFLLNITLRDLPGKCEKKMRKMRENVDRIPPPPVNVGV